jgi:predicted PurR-regulated permease PerM
MPIKTWQKYTITILPILFVGAILYYFSEIVGYIIFAWIISLIGTPLKNFFNKFLGDGLSAGLTLLVFGIVLLIFLRLFIPPLISQAKNLAGIDYNKLILGLEEPLSDVKQWFNDKGIIDSEDMDHFTKVGDPVPPEFYTQLVNVDSILHVNTMGDTLKTQQINVLIQVENPEHIAAHNKDDESYFDGLRSNIFEMFNPSQISRLFASLIGFFGGFVITILSVFFIAFFFLKEQGLFTRMVSAIVPDNREETVSRTISESTTLLIRYFVGLTIQALTITFIASVTLSLFGYKSALLIAFSFAIFNLIPYIGPLLGNFFGVLIVLSSNINEETTGANLDFYNMLLPEMFTLVVILGIVQLIDNFLLQPNIFSKSVKAHPLEIFIVVLMGAKIGGVGGMVLAIPAYTILRVLMKVCFSELSFVRKLTSGL